MGFGTSVPGQGMEKSRETDLAELGAGWQGLPGSGRLGVCVCVWRSPPDQEGVTRAMFVRQLDTW